MKLTATKKALNDALSILTRLIPARSSNPLLTSLKLDASDGNIYMTGTNLEADMRVRVDAEVQGEVSLIIPAHLFAQVISSSKGELVALRYQDNALHVESGGQKARLQVSSGSDAYPAMSFPDLSDVPSVHAKPIFEAISSAKYAISKEAFQAVFRGMKFEVHENKTRFVSSDGYRVAFDEAVTRLHTSDFIVPRPNLETLLSVLAVASDVSLKMDDAMLYARSEKVQVNLKLMDGDFPNYERAIPREFKLTARVQAAELMESVNRVAIFADKDANNRVELTAEDGKIKLKAEGGYGSNEDEVDAELGGVEPALVAAFNARYLLDMLNPIEGEVTLNFSGSATPLLAVPSVGHYRGILVALRE